MVDTSDSVGNNPHGEMGRSGITQAVTQIQCGDDNAQDWDAEVLSHALVHVLNKDQVEASTTNDFAVFVIANGIDDACLLLTMSEDDFKSMGYDVDFKTFCTLQALNKMYNEQILDTMSKDDKNMWFLNLGKQMVMRYMMHKTKVTMIPSATSATMPNVPLGQSKSNKAKLETAWQSSLAMYNVGKPPLAPMPMASNVTHWVTFGPTRAAPNPPIPVTTPAPAAATTTPAVTALVAAPTAMYVTSHAVEFDKGGRQSSSDCGKCQNRKQWSKWHCTLMGSAHEHKCEQVLDPSYAPNPNDPDKIPLFEVQQQFMYSIFVKTLVEGKAANILHEYLDQ